MSSNVGLSTPRGSGTSGYVQRNMSAIRPRDNAAPYHRGLDQIQKHRQRQPNQEILDHDRKRDVELKCFELRDKLEDDGVNEDEIEERVDALRKKLMAELDTKMRGNARNLKVHQVHELAQAKLAENEKLQRALGISADYEEGSHWKKQEEEKIRRQQEAAEREANAALGKTNEVSDKQRGEDREPRSKKRSDSRGGDRYTSRSRSESRSISRSRSRSRTRSRTRSRSASRTRYTSRSGSRDRYRKAGSSRRDDSPERMDEDRGDHRDPHGRRERRADDGRGKTPKGDDGMKEDRGGKSSRGERALSRSRSRSRERRRERSYSSSDDERRKRRRSRSYSDSPQRRSRSRSRSYSD